MQVPVESEIWARTALELDPENQESILLLADVLEANGDILPALELIQQAASPSTAQVPIELDQRLFSLLQRRDSESDPALRNIGTKAYLQALLENDGTLESADRLIRASRWAAWTGDSVSAVTSLRAALALRADSPELLDRLAGELEKLGEFHEAALILWRLDALKPDPATKIRIARMEIARGEAEAAVTLLARAAADSPNDTNLARELAMAREAAGQNFEALESWLRAFELSPPPEKPNLGKSVLKSFSRLSLVDRGLEFLLQTAPRLPDDRLRLELLRDGTTFARENQVLDRWRAILESQAHQPSVAWKMALSELQPEGPAPEPPDLMESAGAVELLLQDAEAKRDYVRATVLSGTLAAMPEAVAIPSSAPSSSMSFSMNSLLLGLEKRV
jgi:thioredoxin-like negative regulator of GroEL